MTYEVSSVTLNLYSLTVVCSDLYGLLLFLAVDPYWVKFWWTKLLYEPFTRGVKQPLYSAISQVLWRTAKDDVIDQVRGRVFYHHLSVRIAKTSVK